MKTPDFRPSVLLVREFEQQMGASSCGRLESVLESGAEYPERRRTMESLGPLYRAISERYGEDIQLLVVDPRNLISLIALVLKEIRWGRLALGDGLRTLAGLSMRTVVVNGRIVARDTWPEPQVVFSVLDALLERRGAASR